MSEPIDRNDQRSLELLAGKALGNLSLEEQAQLGDLEIQESYQATLTELEVTAAAVQLALEVDELELPDALRQRIRADFYEQNSGVVDSETGSESDQVSRSRRGGQPKQARISPREFLAWAACAASILLTLGLWMSGRPPKPLGLADARMQLQTDPGTLMAAWAPGPTPIGGEVSGDVVWNNDLQKGYMRFVGMPINDPGVEQYQLWIIDPGRDAEPVDGGVFDISSSREVIIPIDAKLKVVGPQAFAITIEQPGGVVVSTQERLPLLASVN